MLRTLLPLAALLLAAAPAARAEPNPVQVQAQEVGDVYVVRAGFDLPPGVSRQVAWQVLTDFADLGRFVGSVKESRVLSRDAKGLLLQQVLVGKLMMFSRTAHLLLRVTEDAPQSIAFDDVSRRDFELYRGAWDLRPGEHGLHVGYLLRAKPRHGPPALLGHKAIDDGVAELLQDLRNEMVSRAAREARAARN